MFLAEITELMNFSILFINLILFARTDTWGSVCVIWVELTEKSALFLFFEAHFRCFCVSDLFVWHSSYTLEQKSLFVTDVVV